MTLDEIKRVVGWIREACEPLPFRTELVVLSADVPQSLTLGFAVSESLGIGAYNPRGLARLQRTRQRVMAEEDLEIIAALDRIGTPQQRVARWIRDAKLSSILPAGIRYYTSGPEFMGRMPVRTELTVLASVYEEDGWPITESPGESDARPRA